MSRTLLYQLIDTVDQLYLQILYKACQLINIHINKNKTSPKYMYLLYIYMNYSHMVPKNQSISTTVNGISLQFNTDPRSQLGNLSHKLRMLSTPNGLNYLVNICILQFDLFQVNLRLQYQLTQNINAHHTSTMFNQIEQLKRGYLLCFPC